MGAKMESKPLPIAESYDKIDPELILIKLKEILAIIQGRKFGRIKNE